MNRVCDYFRRISLRKRFIYVFSTTTIVTILASIILIEAQLVNITHDISQKLQTMHNEDISVSTANNLEALLLSYQVILNSYANKVRQLATSFNYFTNNPNQYTSNQFTTYPQNCSTLPAGTKNYNASCLYYYNENQVYPQTSFFDVLLPTLLLYNQQYVQRINVIYYNNLTNNVTTIRSYPAAPITLNNLTQIQSIYSVLRLGYINISSYYIDIFSNSNATIVALSTVVNLNSTQYPQYPNTRIILQVQMVYAAISVLYRNVLYFPGSIIIYCYYNPLRMSNVIILSVSETYGNISVLQSNAYAVIVKNVTYLTTNNVDYYASSIKFAQSLPIDITQIQSVIRNPNGNFYMIQLVPSAEIDKPYASMTTYLRKQNFIIGASFGFTTLIALFTVVSFSFMASNGISSRLNKIAGSLQKYLNGVNHNAIIIKLKKLAAQNLIKKLAENIISLIRKIEDNKAEFANTTETYKHQYPENDFDIDFLRRINSKSADLWPAIETKLMNKYPSSVRLNSNQTHTRDN